ncbi:hypothetical protein AB0L97_37850 [Nocardia sp. NPDC051911]|uniref:hypothetical protein n=1 Tax=Nocardia sp. NPDC051911 TaxID=3154648 RepID=UPI00343D3256
MDTETTAPGLIDFEDLAATDPALAAAAQWYKGLILIGAEHERGYPCWVGKFPHMVDGELDQWEEWSVSIGRDRETKEWHIEVSTNELVADQLSNAGAEGLITTIRAAQAAQRAMDAGYFFLER